jgi:hypothetical protein
MDKPDEDHQKSAAYLLASAFIYLGLSTMKLILRKVAGRSDGKASRFAKSNPGALAAGSATVCSLNFAVKRRPILWS